MAVANDHYLYAIFAGGNPAPVLAQSRVDALAKCYELSLHATEAWNTPSHMWCFNTDERIGADQIVDEWQQLCWPLPKRAG